MGICVIRTRDSVGDLTVEPELYAEVRAKQKGDPKLEKWRAAVEEGVPSRFVVGIDGGLRFGGRWCVPDDEDLKRKILTKAYSTPYSVHPGGDKLYKDLKKTFWWPGMKKEVAEFVSRCLKGNNMIWVIVDRLTKTAHFIPMKDTWSKAELAKAYGKNIVRQKMRAAQDRQKSYADLKRSEIEFAVGDKVLLKVSPMKGVMQFGKRGKLSQNYIGPYEILDRVGEVAYRLALPPALAKVHNIFPVSQLRKYVSDLTHVLAGETVEMDDNLSYEEVAKEILDRKVRKTRNSEISLVKVLGSNHNIEEATWEVEAEMREKYPHLFA
ncbi:uncharacterized protein LOC141608213 [Silene latifolia]|uniref:uncharacterized protein LOC141608213 n=1 Tax=Silene latifolia TaxID=37657 RepID=UPI003D7753DB